MKSYPQKNFSKYLKRILTYIVRKQKCRLIQYIFYKLLLIAKNRTEKDTIYFKSSSFYFFCYFLVLFITHLRFNLFISLLIESYIEI